MLNFMLWEGEVIIISDTHGRNLEMAVAKGVTALSVI